jgi:hypothetical protein
VGASVIVQPASWSCSAITFGIEAERNSCEQPVASHEQSVIDEILE